MRNAMRVLSAGQRGASLSDVRSGMHLLRCPANLEDPAQANPPRSEDRTLPQGAAGLAEVRARRAGNPPAGQAGCASAGAGIVNLIVNRAREAWGGDVLIILPWPPKELSPNTRQHWSKLAKAKKAYREACMWQSIEQGAKRMDCAKLHLSIEFVPPNRRGFDLDNLLSRLKSGLDGLSDVLGVNDRNWSLTITRSDTVGGMVKVTISRMEGV